MRFPVKQIFLPFPSLELNLQNIFKENSKVKETGFKCKLAERERMLFFEQEF
jgi:hypothetical protein